MNNTTVNNVPLRPVRRKKYDSPAINSMMDELSSAWIDDNNNRTLTIVKDMNMWAKSQLFHFYNLYHYELFKIHNNIVENTYTFVNLPDDYLSMITNNGILNIHTNFAEKYGYDFEYISECLSLIGLLSASESTPVIENIINNYLNIMGNKNLKVSYQEKLAALYQLYYSQYDEQLQLFIRSLAVYYNKGELLRAVLNMNDKDFYRGINKEISLGVWL